MYQKQKLSTTFFLFVKDIEYLNELAEVYTRTGIILKYYAQTVSFFVCIEYRHNCLDGLPLA